MATKKKRMDFSGFPRRELKRDEALFQERDRTREMYVLLAGSLGVFRGEVQVATIDEPLSIVGETSALTRLPRSATVRAIRASNLVVVKDPDELFEEYPQIGTKLARMLAQRVSSMNAKFVEVQQSLARSLGRDEPTVRMAADSEDTAPVVAGPRGGTTARGEAAKGEDKAARGDAKGEAASRKGSVPPVILRRSGKTDSPEELTQIGMRPLDVRMAARASKGRSSAARPAASEDGEKTLPMISSPASPQRQPAYPEEVMLALSEILDWDTTLT